MDIIVFKDAKAAGLKYYCTGVPCKHGHVSKRRVSNRNCCKCLSVLKEDKRKANGFYRDRKVIAVAWADLKALKDLYCTARSSGAQVDHIIPRKGKKVCGLHVEYNLQLLSPEDNARKGNKWDGTYDNTGY